MRFRSIHIVYILILACYAAVGYFNLYSNNFTLYFVVGSLIFLFMVMT